MERSFSVGDEVLVLVPVETSALSAKFEGPFKILKKLSECNFLISTPDKRKSRKVIHVNRMKKFTRQEKETPEVINCAVSVKQWEEDKDFMGDVVDVKLKNGDVLSNLNPKIVHLSLDQAQSIVKLLEDYEDLCCDVPQVTPLLQHDVQLVPGAVPIRQSPYRMSQDKLNILNKEIQFLLENGIIEPSNSDWASPAVLVPKPDGDWRLCADFRKVNAVTVHDSWPLARIDDIIDKVGRAKFITKVDLLKGYYQIPLTETAKRVSAMITPSGIYSYRTMPFGMRGAPATFTRLISSLTADLDGVAAYLDDMVVFHETWEAHVMTLRTLFERLRKAKLTIDLCKSEFGHGQLIVLGHKVGLGQVLPIDANIRAIKALPIPKNRKAVQRFLGMTGYYRRFCPNFARIAKPLTDLTSPKRSFVWSDECQIAFDQLKLLICSNPVLKSPDFTKPFVLQVDASEIAAGAVLLQEDNEGVLHPVSYASTKFKPYQKQYSTIEKEAVALLMALEKFEVYIDNNRKVVVYSDHNPLQFVKNFRNKNVRLMRWALALQRFNIEIRHIKGSLNLIADNLSRPSE